MQTIAKLIAPGERKNKIFICKKEIQAIRHWLRMISKCIEDDNLKFDQLNDEYQQLIFIFQKITNTLRNGNKNSKIKNYYERNCRQKFVKNF